MDHISIACRSPQAIRDDELVAVHTELGVLLNQMCSGVCLYRGAQRQRIAALRAEVEAEILGIDRAPAHLRWCVMALL